MDKKISTRVVVNFHIITKYHKDDTLNLLVQRTGYVWVKILAQEHEYSKDKAVEGG